MTPVSSFYSIPLLRALIVFVTCVSALLPACAKHEDVIATLDQFAGNVERSQGAKADWEAAKRGTSFIIGSAVRTRASSTATLRLFDDSTLSLDANTLIRFLSKATGKKKRARLDLEMGEATLEAKGEDLDLDLQVGTAMLDAHSKVRLKRDGGATRIEVLIGSARILTDKETVELSVGEASEIKPDHTQERLGSEKLPAPVASIEAPKVSEDAGATVEGQLDAGSVASESQGAAAIPPGPDVVDMIANAGDSFVIHDPRPPTALGFTQSKCAGKALLVIDPDQAHPKVTSGAALVSARFPRGSHRYVVKCANADVRAEERVAAGSVSVFADDGSRTLPKSAPVSRIDLDGRRYTVMYQGRLPGLDVHWPNAPEASNYSFTARSKSGDRSFRGQQSSYRFPSGTLSEGEHTLEAQADGRRARPTIVVLQFDNAAPTASISSPADGSFSRGSTVQVSGTAQPGWVVTVDGQELTQDRQNRFGHDVTAPNNQRALSIRFTQPGRGVHYYLRRSVQ